jgi:hypothetical protein
MLNQQLINALAELAEIIETGDPIDWGMLPIDEKTTYQLMANQVLELYESLAIDQREMTILATVVKLVVENFVLNMKLMK